MARSSRSENWACSALNSVPSISVAVKLLPSALPAYGTLSIAAMCRHVSQALRQGLDMLVELENLQVRPGLSRKCLPG